VEVSDAAFTDYGEACAALDLSEAFYQIGELYTFLLPADYRTRHGIYYTPPPLVARLLDLLEAQGIDWATARVLDPACGGAAFAAYVAQRMLAANRQLSPEARLRDLSQRLVGIDLDPFAAWLSAVLLDLVCLPLLRSAKRTLEGVIRLGDALELRPQEAGPFDVVIGNPPYGKLTLGAEQRARFKRSLYGHANLYGVFTDLAVRLTAPDGVVGFVTPTSFLGGEYFKNLRRLLTIEARPVHASFVTDREGVFSDVLQETMLIVIRKTPPPRRGAKLRVKVESIRPQKPARGLVAEALGSDFVIGGEGEPWILPRSREQVALTLQLEKMPARLRDYGYRVATGQLVWNRHKTQFRDRPGSGCYPVLWAECIQPDGSFVFRAENRNHRPYIQVPPEQAFLINSEPCVLVQRTTAKEQRRRLLATAIPNSFAIQQPGFVVENHVNMLVPTRAEPAVPMWALAQLLNSATVDHAFRCISGSVAVSAYEMENLPLPPPLDLMRRIGRLGGPVDTTRFEQIVRALYHDS
jgi:adenine-specific DNA-methyltransferase